MATTEEDDMRTMNEVRAVPVFDDPDDVGAPLMNEVRPFDTAAVVHAVNDAPYERTAIAGDVPAWARHAAAANGFGIMDEDVSLSTTCAIYHEARASRAVFVYGFIVRCTRWTAAAIRRAAAWLAQRRHATATRFALDALDDRTLRDLGFHPSEIGSIAAEATGRAERTRRFRHNAADLLGARSFP
jgi:uncharacterized protein YjiS (DUF1127 family)